MTQEEWITHLKREQPESWRTAGRRQVAVFGIGDEFDDLMGHFRADGMSEEGACKKALTYLVIEYDLDLIEDGGGRRSQV